MTCRRPPIAPLRPVVSLVWATDGGHAPAAGIERERVLPGGAMHVVFRLGGHPLRLFDAPEAPAGRTVGSAILGGVRTAPYCKELSAAGPTVGAMLRPGAMEPVSRAPAGALAGAHTPLEDIWPPAAVAILRERLEAAASAGERLAIFEGFLARHLPAAPGIDPRIARALAHIAAGGSVGAAVRDSGYSHRHFSRAFERAVGVTPKSYARLLRFNRVLDRIDPGGRPDWADIAAEAGYADQAHMSREFRGFAGVTPGQYRRAAPADARHVPIRFDRSDP